MHPVVRCALLYLCICSTCTPVVLAAAFETHMELSIDIDNVLSETLDEYVSVDMDWWHNTTHDCAPTQGHSCWGNAGALWVDLYHPTLRSAAAALAPGFLRIGGSLDNYVR